MSPYEKLEAVYARHPKEEPLAKYVEWHLRHGFVFARPDFFAMGRPVSRKAPPAEILNPARLFSTAEIDCWYLHAAAGNMSKMWTILPFPLGWFCFTRAADPLSELVFVESERLRRLCPPDVSAIE